MISRRTTLALAEVYARAFYSSGKESLYGSSRTWFNVNTYDLYDFLYSCNYAAWFCNKAQATHNRSYSLSYATRTLKEFIMKLHTGETQSEATPNWTWKQREQLGQEYLENLATDILNRWHSEWKNASSYSKPDIEDEIKQLHRNLELDGYVYKDLRLLAPESDVLDVEEEAGVLESLFTTLRLNNKETIFYHLKLSEEHYLGERWDDSISNSRKFLEGILQEVAALHSLEVKHTTLPDSTYTKPVLVRDYLEHEGLIEAKEKNVIAVVYGLLSETGGHPYMARNDQARLLRHLSLTLSQFAMLRLQGCLDKSSR
jgi:hypothetical protein